MPEPTWKKRIVALLIAYMLYLWSWNSAFGAEVPPLISLKGYLSKEQLQIATEELSHVKMDHPLVIILNSSSGDLVAGLEFAKKLYELKRENHLQIVVYIEDNAVGPAALIPFLADELDISHFMSWGDIPLGNEKMFSNNILRNRAVSFIDPRNPHAQQLDLIANAMSDPSMSLINDKGLRQAKEGEDNSLLTLSPRGETLVLNHNQLVEMGLVNQVMSRDKFLLKYALNVSEIPVSSETITGQKISPGQLMVELKKHIHINSQGQNTIGHIVIDDRTNGINQSTWLYVKKALDYYKESKPDFVILELNTPGGEVYAAQLISDALKELDTQLNIPVVAYINNWAISAGAMLAYSSRFIFTAKDGSMGAAEPVLQSAEGKMETASEKVNSALRADFANRARFFNRDPLIAEAMVDKDMILVLRHGKVIKLDNELQIHSEGIEPDVVISPKGKLLTLDAQLMLAYGVADMILPPTKTEAITAEEQSAGKWPAKKMSLFSQPFFDEIPNTLVDSYRMDWKMKFFALLASPIVSSLLFLGLLVGVYFEFTTPGFGVAGTIAVVCLFLIILSSFALEIANWLELILLLVGLAIILVELFVLPTFGLLGFIGVIFFLMGLFGMMLPGITDISWELDTHSINAAGKQVFERLAWLCGTLVVAFIIITVLARYVTPSLTGFSRFVLQGNEQNGYIATDNPSDLPQPGAEGEAVVTLRPAGKVVINNTLYDAVSVGSLIEKGMRIEVVKLDGSTIIVAVKKHEESST